MITILDIPPDPDADTVQPPDRIGFKGDVQKGDQVEIDGVLYEVANIRWEGVHRPSRPARRTEIRVAYLRGR